MNKFTNWLIYMQRTMRIISSVFIALCLGIVSVLFYAVFTPSFEVIGAAIAARLDFDIGIQGVFGAITGSGLGLAMIWVYVRTSEMTQYRYYWQGTVSVGLLLVYCGYVFLQSPRAPLLSILAITLVSLVFGVALVTRRKLKFANPKLRVGS